MKLKHFFLILSYAGLFNIFQAQEWINMKFKSAKCKVLDPSYGVVSKCYVKAYNRNVSTLNIDANITKVAKAPIFIECKAHYRFNTITRQIYPTTTFDFCAVMRGDGLVEKLTLFVISFFRDSIPQLFHKCPFYGPLQLYNITLSTRDLPIDKLLPSGIYKIGVTIIHNNTRAFTIDVQVEISSKIGGWGTRWY
jgi:hypothetical protein